MRMGLKMLEESGDTRGGAALRFIKVPGIGSTEHEPIEQAVMIVFGGKKVFFFVFAYLVCSSM